MHYQEASSRSLFDLVTVDGICPNSLKTHSARTPAESRCKKFDLPNGVLANTQFHPKSLYFLPGSDLRIPSNSRASNFEERRPSGILVAYDMRSISDSPFSNR